MSQIANNLQQLNEKIRQACVKAGRNPEEVLLICVTKTRDPIEINEAIDCGITDIGENKVQEITDKFDVVKPAKWHMIGHLQTNKVKYIIDKVSLIHSVDSIRLAEEIDRRSAAEGIIMEILIQVNAANEETKFGIDENDVDEMINFIDKNCEHIKIKGLMTIAPYDPDPENIRIYFRQVKKIFDNYKEKKTEHLDFEHLSMGMSGDFEVAIEEGATMVRVGTAIFGERNYNKIVN